MPTFILSLSWTDQGIRAIKEWPKRGKAARDLARKTGVDIKQVYVTAGEGDVLAIVEAAGEGDVLAIVEAASGDDVARFAMAQGVLGHVRTRTTLAWTEAEAAKLISELP